MARKPRDYKAEYARRQLLGRVRGYSTRRMRGHGGVFTATGERRPSERQLRNIKRRERGDLSIAEEAFVKRQSKKSRKADLATMIARFKEYSPNQRAHIMFVQRSLARKYKTGQRKPRLPAPISRPAAPRYSGGMVAGLSPDFGVPDYGGGDGSGAYSRDEDEDEDEDEFEEFEGAYGEPGEDYPDFDDDWLDEETPFVFYHG